MRRQSTSWRRTRPESFGWNGFRSKIGRSSHERQDSSPANSFLVRVDDSESLELTLEQHGVVVGGVTDSATGAAIPDYRLQIKVLRENGSLDLLYRHVRRPDGRFRLEGLRPATYAIAVASDGYARAGFLVNVEAATTLEHNLVLERGWTLQGRVVDQSTKAPLANVSINVFDRSRETWRAEWRHHAAAHGKTGPDGRFSIPGVVPSRYRLFTYRSGYSNRRIEVEVGDTAPEELSVELIAAGRVVGEIVGLSKRRAVWASLVFASGGKKKAHSIAAHKDTFELKVVPAGNYEVTLREQVVKPEFAEAFYKGGESVSNDDMTERLTPLGELEVVAGEESRFRVDLGE